jgi:glutaminyl-tRNA synthetase
LNPNSLEVVNAALEPALGNVPVGNTFQFERQGYFATDPVDHKPEKPVFNRVVTLRDSWAKIEKEALAQK